VMFVRSFEVLCDADPVIAGYSSSLHPNYQCDILSTVHHPSKN
jgi:hypothetical protein